MVRKGEIACNRQFLHFSQCFLLYKIIGSPFVHIFDILFLFFAELEEPKIGISGKGLRTLLDLKAELFSNFENLGKKKNQSMLSRMVDQYRCSVP